MKSEKDIENETASLVDQNMKFEEEKLNILKGIASRLGESRMSCEFCSGVSEMLSASMSLKMTTEKQPMGINAIITFSGCPKFSECSNNREHRMAMRFNYCPVCGRKLTEVE